jgi:hypothetical protein
MSFESSMRHHNFRSEMMSYANLVQNQVMIFQQQQMVNAQNQTNSILAENEQVRQREKQIDIWMEEFKFQGMSPLESHKQALAEWEINEIKAIGIDYSNEFHHLISNSLEIVKNQISNKPIRKALLGSFSNKFITVSEDSDEVIMYESMAEQNFKEKMSELNRQLEALPKSKLNDDSDIRTAFYNAATTPSPVEILDEISKLLDSLIDDVNSLENSWRKHIMEIDFANKKTSYSEESVRLYDGIQTGFTKINSQLSEFSSKLLRIIKSGDIYEVFNLEIMTPFKQIETMIKQFQKLAI